MIKISLAPKRTCTYDKGLMTSGGLSGPVQKPDNNLIDSSDLENNKNIKIHVQLHNVNCVELITIYW